MEGFKHVDKKVEKLAAVLTCTSAFHEFPEKVLDICEIQYLVTVLRTAFKLLQMFLKENLPT